MSRMLLAAALVIGSCVTGSHLATAAPSPTGSMIDINDEVSVTGTSGNGGPATMEVGVSGTSDQNSGPQSAPPPQQRCSRWRPAADMPAATPGSAAGTTYAHAPEGAIGTVTVHPDGIIAILHYRSCNGTIEFRWIRQEPPDVIAQQALHDHRSTLLAQPDILLSPETFGIVNMETWLSATDPGTITANAGIPGLSVTATAHVASSTWTFTSSHHYGDIVDIVECDSTGVAWTSADGKRPAPCGYTWRESSARGGADQITATLTWTITWTASNGASGTLDPVTTHPTVFDYQINEIQTIGVHG